MSVRVYWCDLTIDDFTIVDQPFLARMFSSGLVRRRSSDLPCSGQGIGIDKLQMPFAVRGDVIDIRLTRAPAGPSIGRHGRRIRRPPQSNQLALKGALRAALFGDQQRVGRDTDCGAGARVEKGRGHHRHDLQRDRDPRTEPQVSMGTHSRSSRRESCAAFSRERNAVPGAAVAGEHGTAGAAGQSRGKAR